MKETATQMKDAPVAKPHKDNAAAVQTGPDLSAGCIEIKESAIHGRGVFACRKFRSGAVIETAPLILLSATDKIFYKPRRSSVIIFNW